MNVACPSCGEKGKLPKQLIGIRIKCKKCSTSFVVTSPEAPAQPSVEAAGPSDNEIVVDGLDDKAWSASTPAAAVKDGASGLATTTEHEPSASLFMASPLEAPVAREGVAAAKQYKVLTPKDKWFDNRFDLARLEEALNHFAKQGWVVRSMATPHITGFSGGAREELVVLLERDAPGG